MKLSSLKESEIRPRKVEGAEREIVKVKRSENGLMIQSNDFSAQREVVESHNRERFANHFHYADRIQGNQRTYDVVGRYNCGACNMANGTRCLLVNSGKPGAALKIDLEAGSCGDWENKCAGDPEMPLEEKSVDSASYGVAANGVGFGCKRCPFASKSPKPDSQGRDIYCGKGDFRVLPNACCALNGAALKDSDDYEGDE